MTAARTIVLRTDRDAQTLWTLLRENWRSKAQERKPLAVTVQEHHRHRSVEQNARLHAMLRDISDQARIDGRQLEPLAWKEFYKRLFLPSRELILPDGEVLSIPVGTSELSVEQMQTFLAEVEVDAINNYKVEFTR